MDTSIFISYRRADSAGWAGHLRDALTEAFGEVASYYDLESVPPGENFPENIDRAISNCKVLLALVGPRWLEMRDTEGRRRLDNPDDLVQLEIAKALGKPTVRVVPVLLGGARMPGANELPPTLSAFAMRNAFEITDSRWDHDCDRLLKALEEFAQLRRMPGKASVGGGPQFKIGEGLVIRKSRVGDLAGVKTDGAPPNLAGATIEVGAQAVVEDSEIGDVAGVKATTDRKRT